MQKYSGICQHRACNRLHFKTASIVFFNMREEILNFFFIYCLLDASLDLLNKLSSSFGLFSSNIQFY